MADFKTATDQVKKETLQSSIQTVMWGRPVAAPGEMVSLRVFLHHVGAGSKIEIEVIDKKGKKVVKHKGTTLERLYSFEFEIPEKAEEALLADVKLPKHGLKGESGVLTLTPAAKISNAKWDREEVRRGDVVGLSADVERAQEGADALVEIYEHDQDGAHDLVTTIRTSVEGEKVDLQWEFQYVEDTDDIPTKDESETGYNPPEYFFRVHCRGGQADSGLLVFKDVLEIRLQDRDRQPLGGERYELEFPDGTKKEGSLDDGGYVKLENVPPGKFRVSFPDLDEANAPE